MPKLKPPFIVALVPINLKSVKCERCKSVADEWIHWQCLPVLHFGDINSPKVKVATIGINPSSTEFLIDDKLKPRNERLPATDDYKRSGRCHLIAETLFADAAQRRDSYFVDSQGKPRHHSHPWFNDLESLLKGTNLGWSYFEKTAVHIDIVACVTTKRWRYVPKKIQGALKSKCADHFQESIATLPDGAILLSNAIHPDQISRSTEQFPLQVEYVEEILMSANPPLKVWKGWLTVGAKGWPFFGWSVLPKNLKNNQPTCLQRWLRRHCTDPDLKSKISAVLIPEQKGRTILTDDTFRNAIPRRAS